MPTIDVLFVLSTPEERGKIVRLQPDLLKVSLRAHAVLWKRLPNRQLIDLTEALGTINKYSCKVVLLKGIDIPTTQLYNAISAFKRAKCCVILIEEEEDWPARNLGEHGRISFVLRASHFQSEINRILKIKEAA